jgi:hypothetical protein
MRRLSTAGLTTWLVIFLQSPCKAKVPKILEQYPWTLSGRTRKLAQLTVMSYETKNNLKNKNKSIQAVARGRTLVDSVANKQMRRQAKRQRDDDKPKGAVEQDNENEEDSPDKDSGKEESFEEEVEEDEEEQAAEPVARIAQVEVGRPKPNYSMIKQMLWDRELFPRRKSSD